MLPLWVIALVSAVLTGILLLALAACIVYKFRRKYSSPSWQFGGVAKQDSVKPKTTAIGIQPRKYTHVHPPPPSDLEKGLTDEEAEGEGLSESKQDWSAVLNRGDTKGSEAPEDGEVKWKVWAKIGYHPDKKCLECTLFRACTEPILSNQSDPQDGKIFSQVTLLPDETTTQTSQSYPNNGSPSFDETFYFDAAPETLEKGRLRISLYENAPDQTRRCLGHALAEFDELSRTETCFVHLHKYLKASVSGDTGVAEALVSMCYNGVKQTLAVAVAGIRNVDSALLEKLKTDSMRLKVDVIVGSKIAKSKFGTASSKLNRIFKWSYNFGISPKHMDATCFRFCLVEENGVEPYGHFMIGPLVYARGAGLEHWKTMLAESRKPIERWHTINLGAGQMSFG